MSKSSGNQGLYPTASSAPHDDFSHRDPPPPSYEESLKMSGPGTSAPPQYYQQAMPSNASAGGAPFYQPQGIPQSYQIPNAYSVPAQHYGYVCQQQTQVQRQVYYNTAAMTSPPQVIDKNNPKNVLYLAKGAKVRTTANGAISIPPPPPGCAPTAGQLAAMQGKPVVVKKQKNSLF